jgi:hypothetical protein
VSISQRRWTRAAGYFLMAVAGVAAIAWPAPAVRAATTPTAGALVYVWAGMLIVGGLAAGAGAMLDRWIGEYVGLWPLVFTFTIYALAAGATGRTASIAGGCLLGAIALLLLARWRDVEVIRREAARYQAEHHNQQG